VKLPEELRARIAADLRPVRPMLRPWQRVLVCLPAVLLACAAAPVLLGVRGDVGQMGPWLAWGGSFVQLALAIVLVLAAFREAVPAEGVARDVAGALIAAGAAAAIALAFVTAIVSPEPRARPETFGDWFFCWRGALMVGAPMLLLLLVLAGRGLLVRPWLGGALAGLAAGSAVDAGWRLYCSYSSPVHVLTSHGGAVLALAIAGTIGGAALGRRKRD
jgi:hypothetical protein